ncbi:Rab GDP-dissociation inhibitor [Ceratocystis platani]|uniref:Rab GDP dissociation inhibitor n=1 Tax=Ceratocystis fimbriata f. sp. platani TaxID=88771 RepID=A0A0F8DLG4_CERFI|nr:Rab GDP-dissociation inhibitor [Ceratocystis platani]
MEDIAPEYDVIVLGTGLTECILSGVLSVKGKKILHIDRNDHYGAEAASVNIETLFKKYGNYQAGEEPWKKYGRANDWNIDLVPKFLMSSGELTRILVSTDVTRYLEFKQVAGSFVQQGSGPKATVAKVPSDAAEALKSPLMGIFEKRRMKSFIEWVGTFDVNNPSTHKGLNMSTCTIKDVFDNFGLEASTRDFIGHAMALYVNDEFMTTSGAAPEAIERIKLYGNSVARYGKSPYIYPLYGLGELPQGFARLSAIYGGTYMLNADVNEFVYDGDKVSGIKATMANPNDDTKFEFETKAKAILADPSYFPGKAKVVGHVLRAICILKHPLAGTNEADSCQVIIPQSQVGRKNDVYIACVSSAHNVCPKGYWIAIVSTIAETEANHHLELQAGLARLGAIEEQFMGPPIPIYEPTSDGKADNVFISKSYDATSHFETTTDDVQDIYRRYAGEELVVEGLREVTVAEE